MDGPLQVALKTSGLGEETIFNSLSTSHGGADSAVKSKMIYDAVSKNTEGARGELGLGWHFGGAHVGLGDYWWKTTNIDTQSGVHFL